MTRWLGQTLHRRVVAMAVMAGVVALGAAAVLIDDLHKRTVLKEAALEGERLLKQLYDKVSIAHDEHGERVLQARLTRESESFFGFDEGRAAFITVDDKMLWQSDERLEKPSGSEPTEEGLWEGIESVFYEGRKSEAYVVGCKDIKKWPVPEGTAGWSGEERTRETYERLEKPPGSEPTEEGLRGGIESVFHEDRKSEAYVVRCTDIRMWPVTKGTAGWSGEERTPETYAVTYHIAIFMERHNHTIMAFRRWLAIIIAASMLALGAAMHVLMRRELRPLDRITRRVSELEAWSGQRIQGCDGDPGEIRTLTDRVNEFLQKLDDTGGWEKTCHGRLRSVLQDAEKELLPESQLNQKGFMHTLSHLLSAIPLTEFKTIPEEEKEVVHKDFMRVRSMIERKLHHLVSGEAGESVRSSDVVAMAKGFFAEIAHSGEKIIQRLMRRRHPDRSFEHHHFELRHEDARLHARIDKDYLYELMFNLLHNAGKAAEAQVRMTIARRGEMVRIVVENDGKRFPSAERETLMIWKDSTDDEREGHGIGLPYVRRTARDHGGDLSLEDSDDLGGARAVLELPLADGTAGDAPVHGAI